MSKLTLQGRETYAIVLLKDAIDMVRNQFGPAYAVAARMTYWRARLYGKLVSLLHKQRLQLHGDACRFASCSQIARLGDSLLSRVFGKWCIQLIIKFVRKSNRVYLLHEYRAGFLEKAGM